MQGKKISIAFCGGCNPRIDRGALAEQVRDTLINQGVDVSFNELDADLIIFISGCRSNCATRQDGIRSPGIVVAGLSLDSMAMDEEDLFRAVIDKVQDFFASLIGE